VSGAYLHAARVDVESFVRQRLYYDLSDSFPTAMSFQQACRHVMSALPAGAAFPKGAQGLPPPGKYVVSSMYGVFGKGASK
jgi:hypothetical protein